MSNIQLTLRGDAREFPAGITPIEVAQSIGAGLAKAACAAKVNGETVDLRTGEPASLTLSGRHDPCIVHRARAVADAMTALTLCDALALRFGTDWLGGR